MLLYVLTNTVNGKKYVGKTVSDNLNKYLSVKRWQAAHGNPGNMPVVAAIAKYGWDKFQVDVLAKASDASLLNEIERTWIADLDARNPDIGYNLQEGGSTGRLGLRLTDEHKRKIGLANKGRKPKGYIRTEKHRQQLIERMAGNELGTKFTSETARAAIANETPERRAKRAAGIQAAWDRKRGIKGVFSNT